MDPYNITISNDKATSYRLVSFIIALINLLAFLYFLLRGGNMVVAILGLLVSATCLIWWLTQTKRSWPSFFSAGAGFLVIAICWMVTGNYLPGILMAVFAALDFYTNRKTIIRVTENGIYYPSMPVKIFQWQQVDFAMIKDGILTIELKDNHIYQFTLDPEVAAAIPETAFNEFCQRQQEAGSHS
jgi:hypothetical protein